MLQTAALPRLTGTLRAFCNVSAPWNGADENDPNELVRKRKECAEKHARSCNMSFLKTLLVQNSTSKDEIVTLLRELTSIAKVIVGSDSSTQIVEGATVYFMEVFRNCNIVGQKQINQLRRMFGVFPPSMPQKIFEVVKNIIDLIDEDVREKILKDGFQGKDEVMQNEEFGTKIKFVELKPLEDSYYLFPYDSDINENEDSFRGLSFKFENVKNKSKEDKIKSKPKTEKKFDQCWLEAEIKSFYLSQNDQLGLSAADIAHSVLQLLQSSKSNDELQNDLFDLLGFERYDLIQSIFHHRNDIVISKQAANVEVNLNQRYLLEPRPSYLTQVTIQSETEKLITKQIRKDEKKLQKEQAKVLEEGGVAIDPQYLKNMREAQLLAAKTTPLFSSKTKALPESFQYPNVYDSFAEARLSSAYISGRKMVLPVEHSRINNAMYEELSIPATSAAPSNIGKNLVPVSSLDEIGKVGFQGMQTLNRIQSIVFDVAYYKNENMLVCAPTGAGKTNIAMLTVLHEIKQNMDGDVLKKDKFKIVYVAPMKALAAEMVRNFSKRLSPLGIQVKELTGDMQLTKLEIVRTQMLVTTPEKWDVVTRKSTGDIALTQQVKLLILDEVHLLDGDRGPVLEALVARTLRQVESTQSMIRILGLSATLPNYIDVARFLRVNPMVGLFFFDDRFRPVPLSQTFIGVKAVNPLQQLQDMDEVCYEKVAALVDKKHQVMVFVHARNATVRTAMVMKDMAQNKGHIHIFTDHKNSNKFGSAQNEMMRSRNRELRELFEYGFAIHHAGMWRNDRNTVERYFRDGLIKVLVCTSTLAWGVNLPAHAVIIKGTEIYDSKHGSFVDIGVLDVMQIFGRAGRPQYDSEGQGTIITTHDKLNHYLSLLTSQHQIESNFTHSIANNLNAEIALGTVSNIEEGIEWLSYTYLYVRMMTNPHAYGLKPHLIKDDFQLLKYRRRLIEETAKKLKQAKMIRYDEKNGYLNITDLGRTASHFYISMDTVDRFNEALANHFMNDKEIFALICRAQEFDQLKVRDDELNELDELLHQSNLPVVCGCENTEGKVNILLQMYLSKAHVESFSLVSDQAYVVQNATRIVRALFEVALRRSWALLTGRLLRVCKMFERQLWDFQTPLRQFSDLREDVLKKIERANLDIDYMKELDIEEIGLRTRCFHERKIIKMCIDRIPYLIVETTIQPITNQILRLRLNVIPDFTWNDKIHGSGSEMFWIWVEDPQSDEIYHFEFFVLPKKQVIKKEIQTLVFTIPLLHDVRPGQYIVRVVSDRWLGSEQIFPVSLKNLILPQHHLPHTNLLDLQPLPVRALQEVSFELLYKFTHFNAIQTQIFHTLYYTDGNVLVGAPTGSGKTIAAEIAMFRVFKMHPGTKVVYIAPLKALVRERIEDWKVRFEKKLGKRVVELTGDVTPDAQTIAVADVIVTTPEKWDGVSRSWQTRNYVKAVSLIVIDEIHLLGEDRGPVLEVIVSRTNFISSHTERTLRIIGLSTALANATDLANWLGIKEVGLYNFRPSVRPVPLEVHVSGYHGKHYCPRMALMNKPAFQAIHTYSPEKPALIFVSSRRQTRLTALDLISFLAAEENPRQWLHMPDNEIQALISTIRDQNLKLTIAFGIGIHHAGLHERDRKISEELFRHQKIQVLIATATLAWGVNLPAHIVVIKGTEYFDGKVQRYVDFPITDVLQMMGRAGRPQYDDHGVAVVLVQDVKKDFYKKFLYEPFPVESSLLQVLPDHFNAEIVAGTISSKQQCLDYLTWTYLFRRLLQNPVYYRLESIDPIDVNRFLSGLVDRSLGILQQANCLEITEDNRTIKPTVLGRIASYYYINYETMQTFREHLKPQITHEKLLWVLCETKEYEELPVRHNEDSMNSDLAKSCLYEVNPYTFDSPHTKANLLFQAHFSRLHLPCTDYHTDLKSVLDQAIRIIQAMIDVSADNGWLSTTISSMTLLQMVLQARWYDDNALLTLPHIGRHHLPKFRITDNNLSSMQQKPIDTLPELIDIVTSRYELLASVLREDLDENQINEVFQTITNLPVLLLRASLKGWWESSRVEESKPLKFQPPCGAIPDSQWMKVHADQEYVLHVELLRKSKHRTDTKALAPIFPKLKEEGWFLVLGSVEKDELVAMKRIGNVSHKGSYQLMFYTPETPGRIVYTLYLISDCYLGLDQQYDVFLNVMESSVAAQINSEVKFSDSDDDDDRR